MLKPPRFVILYRNYKNSSEAHCNH